MAKKLLYLTLVLFVLGGLFVYKYSADAYKLFPKVSENNATDPQFEKWADFVSAIGKFKVGLPGNPQHATEDLPVPDSHLTLKYEMYAVDDSDGDTFMVSLVSYPEGMDMSNPENILENVMNQMLKTNPKNKLQFMQFTNYQDFPSLDFNIENPEIIVNSRSFIKGQILYLLTMIGKKEKFDSSRYDYFIHSFELLPDSLAPEQQQKPQEATSIQK